MSWRPALDRRWSTTPDGRLFVLPTYTALLELREELSRRGPRRAVLGPATGGPG